MTRRDRPPPPEPASDPDMEKMKSVAAEMGIGGDLHAIEVSRRLRLDRRRGVALDLPPVTDLASLQVAQAAVIDAAAAGQITTREALDLGGLLEYRRRAIMSIDIEARLRALEEDEGPTGAGAAP